MNTEEEMISAEERRLARALSREKSGDRPRFGAGAKVKKPEAPAATASTQSTENLPKWKQLQLEKERQAAEAAEAERKKKEEAAAAIAQRQMQLGADADAANVEEEAPAQVSHAVEESGPKFDEKTEDERARREEERLRKMIGK